MSNSASVEDSAIQAMPNHRARLNPGIVRDVSCYVWAFAARYRTEARMTLSGYRGVQRARRKGQIQRARMMVRLIDDLIRALVETVDLRDVDAAVREWESALAQDAPGGA